MHGYRVERLRMGFVTIGKRGWRDPEEKRMEYSLMVDRDGCEGWKGLVMLVERGREIKRGKCTMRG